MHAHGGSGESRALTNPKSPSRTCRCTRMFTSLASGFAIADTALLLEGARRQKRQQRPWWRQCPTLRHVGFRVEEGRRASLAPVAERGPAVRQVEACQAAEAAANVQQRLVHQVDAGAQVQIPQTCPPLGRHRLEELQLQGKRAIVSHFCFTSSTSPFRRTHVRQDAKTCCLLVNASCKRSI